MTATITELIFFFKLTHKKKLIYKETLNLYHT